MDNWNDTKLAYLGSRTTHIPPTSFQIPPKNDGRGAQGNRVFPIDGVTTVEPQDEHATDPWRASRMQLICKAPTLEQIQIHTLDPEVQVLVKAVRALPFRPSSRASPHCAAWETNVERCPLSPRDIARVNGTGKA